jgi:hypothetical protein
MARKMAGEIGQFAKFRKLRDRAIGVQKKGEMAGFVQQLTEMAGFVPWVYDFRGNCSMGLHSTSGVIFTEKRDKYSSNYS